MSSIPEGQNIETGEEVEIVPEYQNSNWIAVYIRGGHVGYVPYTKGLHETLRGCWAHGGLVKSYVAEIASGLKIDIFLYRRWQEVNQ
ncbi:MAG TPA: hypothetical protein PKB13_15110 [Clostridia bacterium]|nr:hypothetical protein [Clostridia bacterium]